MLNQLRSVALKTKALVSLLILASFFIILFSSYNVIRPEGQLCPKTDPNCDGTGTKFIIDQRKRLKTRDRYLHDDDFLRTQSEVQRQRIGQMEKTCEAYYEPKTHRPTNVWKDSPYDILVDDTHKIAYCAIPKIASTSWKRVWLVLTGLANSTYQFSQQVVNNELAKKELRHLTMYSPTEVNHILSNYKKFMFSRHPLSRVLSAFRNKLAPESNFVKREQWQNGLGTYIIKKYRDFDYTLQNYDLTFTEFIRFLTDDMETKPQFNQHWREMYVQCNPCEIHYDFMGKYESLSKDSSYILKMLGIDDIVEFPSINGSSPTNSSTDNTLLSYYSNVPWKYIEDLLGRYQLDIRLFGYGPYPPTKEGFFDWLRRTAEIHV